MMLVYYFYIIVIFGNFAKVLTSSDESKYIDLLPEEEREEFLQKIAKRIFENVESAEGHKKDSGEILDKQLEEHDAFVKKIYEEESQNLRRVREAEAGVDTKENNNEGKEENENHVNEVDTKVIGLEKKNNIKDIDLTVRSTKINNSREIPQKNEAYRINVEVKYDEPITEKVVDSDHTLKEVNSSEDTVEKDIQVRNIRRDDTEEENDGILETVTENIMHQVTGIKKIDPEVIYVHENNSNFTNIDSVESINVTDNSKVTDTIETTGVTEVTTAGEIALTTEITNVTELNKDYINETNTNGTEEIASNEIETTLTNNYNVTVPVHKSEEEHENNTNSCEDGTTINFENVSLASDVTEIPINLTISTADGDVSCKHSDEPFEVFNEANIEHNNDIKTDKKASEHKSNKSKTVTEHKAKPKPAQTVIKITDDYSAKTKRDEEANEGIEIDTRTGKKFVNSKDNENNYVTTVDNNEYINNKDKQNNSYDDKANDESNNQNNILLHGKNIREFNILKNSNNIVESSNMISVNKYNILRSNTFTPTPIIKHSKKNRQSNKKKIETTHIDTENDYSAHSLVNTLKNLLMKDYDHIVKAEKEFNRQSISSGINKLPHQSMKGKRYHVYQIAPNQSPFLRNKTNQPNNTAKTIKEEPYYFPIYNYSPDNAYYNPKNRQGPNSGEDDREDVKYDVNGKHEKSDNFDNDYGFFGAGVRKSNNKLKGRTVKSQSKARYKEIEDLGKGREIQNVRTVTKQPITVKRYKNVGFAITGTGKMKLYLLFDDINKHDINSLKFDENVYKASDIARYSHNDLEKTRSQRNSFKEILINIQPNMIDAIRKHTEHDIENKKDHTCVYVEVLEDMIRINDGALAQYDWLGSTVDIQAALDKLLGLTINLRNGENIHNSDLELFKYVLNLFKSTTEKTKVKQSSLIRSVLPRNNKRLKPTLLKKKGLLERAWLYKRTSQNIYDLYNRLRDEMVLDDFEKFLKRVEDSLHDLHTAIKHIALITKYKKQRWYENLKDLYLKGKKEYLEVVLHLSISRFLGLIEKSAQNGLEDGHKEYIKNNKEDYISTKREFEFVLRILEEIKVGK